MLEKTHHRELCDVLRQWDVLSDIDDLERGFSFTRMSMDAHFRDQLERFLMRLKDWVGDLQDHA
jgi:hypothetical protein